MSLHEWKIDMVGADIMVTAPDGQRSTWLAPGVGFPNDQLLYRLARELAEAYEHPPCAHLAPRESS